MFANLKRREFLSGLTLTTAGLLAKDFLNPSVASADTPQTNSCDGEKYAVFVPYTTAKNGGTQTVTLYSGKPYSVSIPARCKNYQMIQKSNNCFELYTLYNPKVRIADKVYEEINRTSFKQDLSKECCISTYEQIEEGKFVSNLKALELLDYIVATSRLDENIKKAYELASNNSRLIGLLQAINQTLAGADLTDKDKILLLGTFELVKAGQPIPNFHVLTDLDAIVASSGLPDSLKQTYALGSAISRGLTVDYLIVREINNSQLNSEKKEQYLAIYQDIRKDNKISNIELADELDSFIKQSKLPANAQLVYLEARTKGVDSQQVLAKAIDSSEKSVINLQKIYQQGATITTKMTQLLSRVGIETAIEVPQEDLVDTVDDFKNQDKNLLEIYNTGATITPKVTQLLSQVGIETATGVPLGSLAGAAATNSTLAFLGGGSVAAGGLGMLGGLAVVTGGAALIGAAGLVSMTLVSHMDKKDYQNLGIAISGGTLTGIGAVLGAWTAASALGVAGSLSGAAAITATISALGGLSVMTGGAALVASGATYMIWSILKSNKKRDHEMLEHLEARMYASVIS